MFNLPDLSKLEKSIADNTAVQHQLYQQMLLLNSQITYVLSVLAKQPSDDHKDTNG